MRFDVISLFPEQFQALTREGVVARALRSGIASLHLHNPRDYTSDTHRSVDDRPYGGGPGMVMRYEPLARALTHVRAQAAAPGWAPRVAYLSPQGRPLDQAAMARIGAAAGWILVCGRYEGVDERLIEGCVDEQWSIGDYVLSGGELAAMVVMDAVIRLLPGALGHAESAAQDSYAAGLLDCPQYTRPEEVAGRRVPQVLLSGDHAAIARWRLKQALGRTWERRPELLAARDMSEQEQGLLEDYVREHRRAHPRTGTEQERG
jgi:tRNA (guanine37-N1)-methyltransferase